MELDFNTKHQIKDDIQSLEHLLSLKIFESTQDIYVQKAIFTKIMIDLRDLVMKSHNLLKKRIDFEDDVIKYVNGKIKVNDVTDLINFIRNATCHEDSPNRQLDGDTFSFNVFVGYNPNALTINETSLGCNYNDDIAINFGSQLIYYNRHIIRAFEECKTNFKKI